MRKDWLFGECEEGVFVYRGHRKKEQRGKIVSTKTANLKPKSIVSVGKICSREECNNMVSPGNYFLCASCYRDNRQTVRHDTGYTF